MLTALLPLLLGMTSKLPEVPGKAVQAPGVPTTAPASTFVGLNQPPKTNGGQVTPPNAGTPDENTGVVDGALQIPGQSSPQGASTVIDDAAFYVIDPNKPDQRILGTQLREMSHRALQVDNVQSQLHQTQNQNIQLLEERKVTLARLRELETEKSVADQLARMGVSQPAPATPAIQPGVTVAPGAAQEPNDMYERMRQEWGPDGTAAAYGYTGQEAIQPEQPVSTPPPTLQPQTQTQNASILGDPQALAAQLLPIMDQLLAQRLGNIDQIVQTKTDAGFQQLQQERTTQDLIASTIDSARELKSQNLQAIGMTAENIKNTLDLDDAARVFEREAESLVVSRSPADIALAQEKIRQAAAFSSRANENRLQAQMAYNTSQRQQQFREGMDTNVYKALNIEDPGEADVTLTDPRAIQKANDDRVSLAMKLVEENERMGKAAGRL